jgi:phytoene synthase
VSDTDSLLGSLPVLHRLALSYAPARVKSPTLALLALDARLADVVRSASEPMLAQLRLAWWREQLMPDPAPGQAGEPLLVALESWDNSRLVLRGLVDGWEEMTGEAPLASAAFETLANARGEAFASLCGLIASHDEVSGARRLGYNWALCDIRAHLNNAEEQRRVGELIGAQDWRWQSMSRNMRPLVVLHGLAARATRRGEDLNQLSPSAMFTVLRLGFLGR